MLVSTVVAVALGIAPVQPDGRVTGNYDNIVGRYVQTVDASGKTHVRGCRLNGAAYELTLDKYGNVEGSVGDWSVTFRIQELS
jgi:hypothetical protein